MYFVDFTQIFWHVTTECVKFYVVDLLLKSWYVWFDVTEDVLSSATFLL